MTNPLRTGAEMVATELHRIHQKRSGINNHTAPYGWDYCAECQQTWPCATEQALERALSGFAPHDESATRSSDGES